MPTEDDNTAALTDEEEAAALAAAALGLAAETGDHEAADAIVAKLRGK